MPSPMVSFFYIYITSLCRATFKLKTFSFTMRSLCRKCLILMGLFAMVELKAVEEWKIHMAFCLWWCPCSWSRFNPNEPWRFFSGLTSPNPLKSTDVDPRLLTCSFQPFSFCLIDALDCTLSEAHWLSKRSYAYSPLLTQIKLERRA